MLEVSIFIVAVIAGITQFVKSLSPNINGSVTILIAMVVGVVVALVDTQIGLPDVSMAQGIMYGLGTAGITGGAKMIGGGDSGETVINGQVLGE